VKLIDGLAGESPASTGYPVGAARRRMFRTRTARIGSESTALLGCDAIHRINPTNLIHQQIDSQLPRSRQQSQLAR
jgi:hypothetical protein